jgi:hypothetical protein
MGDARAAWVEARGAKSPQERLIVSLRISTKLFFKKQLEVSSILKII